MTLDGEPILKFQSTSSMWRTTSQRLDVRQQVREFQSTSSMWRTTGYILKKWVQDVISIHVLHVEDDSLRYNGFCGQHRFQSTSSMWRTTT